MKKIYSMTGFGRAEHVDSSRKIAVEIKSVNHRYLDISIKMPKKLSVLEPRIRKVLKEYMKRGKVDVFITYESLMEDDVSLSCNMELAGQYLNYAGKIAEKFGIDNDVTTSKLMAMPDVMIMEEQEPDEEELWSEVEPVLREAGEKFAGMRSAEGERLREDVCAKLDVMERDVGRIMEREPSIIEEYKDRLKDKTRELLDGAEIDEGRIAAEVVIFADKISTDEETVRLKSHIRSMRETLSDGDDVGRKLDFLAQEMNREANTTLSKSGDSETNSIGVELKTVIEKIREQIQNIE